MSYRLLLAPTALEKLKAVTDRRIKEKVRDSLDRLAEEPDKQGKPLTGELIGYRSLRAVGQRYRIVYQIHAAAQTVEILTLGLRKEGSKKDVYALAKRLLGLRSLRS